MSGHTHLEIAISTGEIDAEMLIPGAPTPTAPEAAKVLGVDIEQIIKSLVFVNSRSELALAIISGPDRVDRRKLSEVSGLTGLKLAAPDVVLERTGYRVGSMPPVAHLAFIPAYIDQRVSGQDLVFGGGGVAEKMIAIKPSEIIRATDGVVAEIAESTSAAG